MDLLDEAIPGSGVVPRGRVGTEEGEDIKEGSPVGVSDGISDGQKDGHNQAVFFYSD